MSTSCLLQCQDNDVIVWNNGNETRVIGYSYHAGMFWPMVAAVDYSGIEAGHHAVVTPNYLPSIVKIIKTR